MGDETVSAKYWTCPRGCGARWERRLVKCRTEGCTGRRPKKPMRAHMRTLRDDSYTLFEQTNEELHAGAHGGEWSRDCCGVCGKPPSQNRKHDRDHDHLTGERRGLACGGNTGCNVLMLPWVTASTARGIADAKQEAGEPDAPRWVLIAAYLERVEAARA